jgi:hypothetical protein
MHDLCSSTTLTSLQHQLFTFYSLFAITSSILPATPQTLPSSLLKLLARLHSSCALLSSYPAAVPSHAASRPSPLCHPSITAPLVPLASSLSPLRRSGSSGFACPAFRVTRLTLLQVSLRCHRAASLPICPPPPPCPLPPTHVTSIPLQVSAS